MFDHELQLELPRPPAQVWAFYADVRNNPSYIDGLEEARLERGALHGPGERTYRLRYASGQTATLELEVLTYRPPETLRTRWTAGELEVSDTLTLAPAGAGTRFSLRIEGRVIEGGSVLRRLAGAVLERGPGAQWSRRVTGWNRAYARFAELLEPGRGAVRRARCAGCGAPILAAHDGPKACVFCGAGRAAQ